ncbi:MAG: TolB family protein [Gemmatimonadales bacterium]
MGRFTILFYLAPLAAVPCPAQGPPATDIFLAELRVRDGRVSVSAPVNVTNRDGYDNQPFFLPDGRALLYTAIGADGQADIYRYDLTTHRSVRVTATPESEYSPTPTADGGFSVVRVESDSTQRLWRFDPDGSNPRLVLAGIKPVGYHAWADEHTVALFVLGSPPTLQLADTRTGRADTVARDIGRSLLPVPGGRAVAFVHKISETQWISQLDRATREARPLVRTLEGQDFFAWTPDGILLAGKGTKVFQWTPASGTAWVEIADFAAAGLADIGRLAVSPRGDRLAIAAIPKTTPR